MNGNLQGSKCPLCGGEWAYDHNVRAMACPYCDNVQRIPGNGASNAAVPAGTALNQYREIQGISLSSANMEESVAARWGDSVQHLSCRSCGAELMFDGSDISRECPFCNSANIQPLQGVRIVAPAGIIPFRVNRDGVSSALRLPLSNNVLVPRDFKQQCTADQLNAIYFPAWVFSAQAQVSFVATYKTENEAKTTRGTFRKEYANLAVKATNRAGLGSINISESYRIPDHVPYQPELLSGYVAERYSVDVRAAWEEAKEGLRPAIERDILYQMAVNFGAHSATFAKLDVRTSNETVKMILLPLWMKNVPYKGKTYLTSVNGQNGMYRGDYPALFGR